MIGASSPAPDFAPVTIVGLPHWSAPDRLDFLDALAFIELADSEILHLSHYAPLVIHMGPCGPVVGLMLHPALSTATLARADGRWAPLYKPLAIRSLPFRNPARGVEPEFAPSLCGTTTQMNSFLDDEGEVSREFQQMMNVLRKLARGRERLAQAACVLMAADLLVPLVPLADRPDLAPMVVSAERLAGLPPRRAASLTADANIGYELAAASIFSQRWLTRDSIVDTVAPGSDPRGVRVPLADGMSIDRIDEPVTLDDSHLFPVEEFLRAARAPS